MIQCITDYSVIWGEDGLKQPSVRIEAGWVEDGVVVLVEGSDFAFKVFVAVLGAADEADTGHAEAVGVYGMLGSFGHFWVVCKAKVIICTEIQDLFTISLYAHILPTCNHSFYFECPRLPCLIQDSCTCRS